MTISEKKIQIVIDNYFKSECSVNTSIRQAFEKGFRIGIKKLPSAEHERPKGEWIDHTEDGYVECPFCRSATNCDENIEELHFCFSCGAKMER